MDIQIDSLTVKDFEQRYGVARSNIYNRLAGLKAQGHDTEPEKLGNRSIYNADQIALMDRLDDHLKAGGTIDSFSSNGQPSHGPTGQIKPSYRTQDTKPDAGVMAITMLDAIASKVVEAITLAQPSQLPPAAPDPLAGLRVIEEAHTKGWLLSTSQLAPLLGLKSLSGKEVHRYGYTFTRTGKNGSESAWKISKL